MEIEFGLNIRERFLANSMVIIYDNEVYYNILKY